MNYQRNVLSSFDVSLNTETLFLLSTSGSQSSIEKHNKALRNLGLNVAYFTFSREITPEYYAGLFRSPIIRGGAVTGQGLKSGIIPFLNEIDDLAQKTGAVNTVINNEGKLFGYNTDAFGLEAALRQHIDSSGIPIKNAIIYGNGGVSGVAAFVLKKMGISPTMTGRNQDNVSRKMKELDLDSFSGPYDLVVNATPVTSEPLEKAVRMLDVLRNSRMVFDHNMPEKDNKTNYLQSYCQRNGIYFIPGKEMYYPQMIKQWKLFLNGIIGSDGKPVIVSEEDIIKSWGIEI